LLAVLMLVQQVFYHFSLNAPSQNTVF
jgi:hypothetical protein